MADGDDVHQKRKFFRIEYPKSERPAFRCGGKDFSVLDVSEEGVRFELPLDHTFQAGDRLTGALDFCGRAKFDIKGTLLRVGNGFAVLSLERHLPLPHIVAEQRYLFHNFHRRSS